MQTIICLNSSEICFFLADWLLLFEKNKKAGLVRSSVIYVTQMWSNSSCNCRFIQKVLQKINVPRRLECSQKKQPFFSHQEHLTQGAMSAFHKLASACLWVFKCRLGFYFNIFYLLKWFISFKKYIYITSTNTTRMLTTGHSWYFSPFLDINYSWQ